MRIYNEANESGNIIVTHAIGGTYLNDWERFSLPTWLIYCKKHNLGLYVIDEQIRDDSKSLYWQKFLIGNYFKKQFKSIKNLCYLDTDIIINPTAPNIFDIYDDKKIAIISQKKNLPFNLNEALRRIAFFRHHYLSNSYPLDSSLFMSTEDVYNHHNLQPQSDFACTGVFLFNIDNHADLMEDWFNLYDSEITSTSIDGGGEEVYLNYHILSNNLEQLLDYKWQALWIYEMSWNHSHLYIDYTKNMESVLRCIETSLFNNYFLHFAGTWEGSAWKFCNRLFEGIALNKFIDFNEYMNKELTGKPVGILRAKK